MVIGSRIVFFVVFCGCVWLTGCGSPENEYQEPPPPEVTVARPVIQMVTPFLEKNGETEAVQEAEVRARVTGFVEEVKFQAGQDVEQGDVLYIIESDQYEAAVSAANAEIAAGKAAVDVAEASVKNADAEVKRAGFELKRQQELLRRGAGAQSDLDTAIADDEASKAAVDSAAAQIKAAQAQTQRAEASLAKAQLDLRYTTVTAPISGMVSKTEVKTGNLVESGTELATVVNHEQIYANFSVNDREILHYLESERDVLEKGDKLEELDWRKTTVYMGRDTDEGFPFEGKMDYVDPEGLQQNTGTLGLRAVFDNRAKQLLPGMFVTVRVAGQEERESLLIPEYALGRDQQGSYVLTIDADNKVQRTGVTIYKSVSGWAIVETGLTQDSKVVIEGIQRARPGLKVAPIEEQLSVDRQMLLRGISVTGKDSQAGQEGNPLQQESTDQQESPETSEQN